MEYFFDDENVGDVVNHVLDLIHPVEVDETRGPEEVPRNKHFFEQIIPRYDDILLEHFRMSRNTMEVLIYIHNFYI